MEAKADCKFEAGEVRPVVNRERCENKGTCVTACPYDVFVVRVVDEKDKRALSTGGRIKLWVHGGKQAYADFADRCHGCGLCLTACPESAISLQKVR
jgi:NAD-dependent dihydropyrimidine dehydrogenase PreA subunit